ncbi:MAG: hypothetical protein E7256_10725 [Lachnospiraceae bacterium]|nr:hypothetical protein [Lachnospiraceae bacterium]
MALFGGKKNKKADADAAMNDKAQKMGTAEDKAVEAQEVKEQETVQEDKAQEDAAKKAEQKNAKRRTVEQIAAEAIANATEIPNPRKKQEQEQAEVKKYEPKVNPGMLGFALYKDVVFDVEEIIKRLKDEVGIEDVQVDEREKMVSLIIKVDGDTFACSHMAMPVPRNEAVRQLQFNFVEPETATDVKEHKAFIVLSRINDSVLIRKKACNSFSKIATVLMGLDNAAAMFLPGLNYIISPVRYRAFLPQMMDAQKNGGNFFPILLWENIGLYPDKDGVSGCTQGLNDFGLFEFCLYNTKRDPKNMYMILMQMSVKYLVEEFPFKNGDVIRLDEKHEAVLKEQNNILYIIELN